jgi:hypothetical protein
MSIESSPSSVLNVSRVLAAAASPAVAAAPTSNPRNRATNWCFTAHFGRVGQPSREDVDAAANRLFDSLGKYIIGGFEEAPATGQQHLQAYIQLKKPCRLSEIKRVEGCSTFHFEPAKADEIKNREYCTKACGEDFIELGEISLVNPGLREADRWREARLAAVQGRIEDVPDQVYVQHYSSIRYIARDHLRMPSNAPDTTGVWFYGLTGSGKSRLARETYGTNAEELYLKPLNKWWDGYRDQPHALLEDFGKDHSMLGYHLKIWADRYAFPAEIKGGMIALRPQTIAVTSQYHPKDIWSDSETLDAILRRFRLHYVGPEPNPWTTHPMFIQHHGSVPQSSTLQLPQLPPLDAGSRPTSASSMIYMNEVNAAARLLGLGSTLTLPELRAAWFEHHPNCKKDQG